jgi:hypothetical protein
VSLLEVEAREDRRTMVRRVDTLIGGPVWWAMHLGGTYWLVPRACAWGTDLWLHVLTVAMVALCGRAWLSGVQLLRGARLADPDTDPTARRDVYLAWLGILLSIFFGAVTLFEGLPALFYDACAMTPTS